MQTSRNLSLIALALFMGLALPNCGGPSEPTAGGGTPGSDAIIGDPEEGDWLVENLSAEPAHLNPLLSTGDASSSYIGGHIFETLLKVNNETMEFEPQIAKSWEISDDHLLYTFLLRDDVTFSDGVGLTARDVRATYDIIMNPENDTANLRNYLQDIEEVEVIDDYTVSFKMKKPYFRHMLVLALFDVYPAHIYTKGELNTHPNNRHPIGSGPYIFSEWDTQSRQIVLERNKNYWDEFPPLDKHVFKIIEDDNAAFQALERHDIDIDDLPPEKWVRQAARPKFEAEFNKIVPDSPIPGYLSRFNYIGWNTRKPQFDDKRVRQALCMLFDRKLVVDEVWYGYGTVLSGSIFHKAPEYNNDIEPWPFDPERAKELLAEAGWVDRDQDGVRERNGVKFEFELTYSAGVPEYDQLGAVYQEELRRAGIKMDLNPMEWATFQERVHERTFDACMLAWLTTLMPDPYQLWHSSQAEKGSNYPGWKNDEVDEILETARTEFDHEKRIAMYHRFHELQHEEQPYIFLYARPGLIALDKRFQGVELYPAGLDPLEWWVPKSMQRYP